MKSSAQQMLKRVKPFVLPASMAVGALCHGWIGDLQFLCKYLIFAMLLITYCRINLREIRLGRFVWLLLAAQLGAAVGSYYVLREWSEVVAQGAFICILCPTATAAPVITGMLGGSVSRVASYSLVINLAVAVLAPVFLSMMAVGEAQVGFWECCVGIAANVGPLIVGPLVVAMAMERWAPGAHRLVATHQALSFYLWALTLLIVVGVSVSFLMQEPASALRMIVLLAAVALVCCAGQFRAGRKIGRATGDAVSGAQSFGQKNTTLAIYLTLTFMNPIVSAAPVAYVAWHNIVNSWQIYIFQRRMNKGNG